MFGGRGSDDPFITYRYAHNLATGNGLVYNLGDRILSTTTPLYAMLLAIFKVVGLDIPWVSNTISCFSLGAGAWALWALLQRWGWSFAAGVALVMYPLSSLLLVTIGLETPFSLAVILWAMLLSERERWTGAAVLFAVATLTRLDAVLAVAMVVAYGVVVRRRFPPWRAILTYCMLLVPWVVFATAYYGSPLPVTLTVKRQQALMPQSDSFAKGIGLFFVHYWTVAWLWPHLACAVLGAIAVFVRFQRSLLVLGWIVAYTVAYVLLGVTRYGWYYAPLVMGISVLIALGIEAVFVMGRKPKSRRIAAAITVVVLMGQVYSYLAYHRVQNGRLHIYHEVGTWLRDNTEADATIGALEVGIIGYYAERRIIDFAGLLQPDTAAHFSPTTSYEDTAIWSAQVYHPDYLILHEHYFPRLEALLADRGNCHRLNAWTDPDYEAILVAYNCLW